MRSCRKPSWNPANPEACRIPGHRKHMVDAERIKAHHMRLRADQVSVTASDVDQRPKSVRACTRCPRAMLLMRVTASELSARVNASAPLFQSFRAFHELGNIQIPWRVQLHDNGMPLLHDIDNRRLPARS